MSFITAFFSVLSFLNLYTPKPTQVEKLKPNEYKAYNDIFTRFQGDYTSEVIGFQNESENLLGILCFLAAKEKGGVIVVSGELARVKHQFLKLTSRTWSEIHAPNVMPERTIDTASFKKGGDSSLLFNRIIKEGLLYLRHVDLRASSIPTLFAELQEEIQSGKLLCIVEVDSTQEIGTDLFGLKVSGWVDFTTADKEVVEHEIKTRWVDVSRERGIKAYLTDSDLVRGVNIMLKDPSKDTLENLMECLVRVKRAQEEEPPVKKLKTDTEPSATINNSNNITNTTTTTTDSNNATDTTTDSNNATDTTTDSNNATDTTDSNNATTATTTDSNNENSTNSSSKSGNEASVVGDNNGSSCVPVIGQEVTVRDMQEDYTEEVPKIYVPARAAKRELSKALKKPVRPVDQVTSLLSSISPSAADLIPHAAASRFVKTTLDVLSNKGKDQDNKRKRDEGT